MSDLRMPPKPTPQLGGEALPPVQAPTSGFLLQLFFIPLLIVIIIVVVWMLFSWLAHMGASPRELAKEISGRNNASWQRAVTLAEMLDAAPTGAANGVRRDREMALDLARKLDEARESGAKDEASIKLQEFLCSALGKFEVIEPIDALAAATENNADEALLPVRTAAANGLAELLSRLIEEPKTAAANLEKLQSSPTLVKQLIQVTRDQVEIGSGGALRVDEIRSRAAYSLGLIGGKEALDRLAVMIQDRSSNARNNAAFGLARHGDIRALPGIVEMLDPTNESAMMHEEIGADQKALTEAEANLNKDWKRSQVLQNGLSTAKLLIDRNQGDDLSALAIPIDALTKVELSFYRPDLSATFKKQQNREIQTKAESVKQVLEERGVTPK